MKSPAEIIRKLLLDLGHGLVDGNWSTFVGYLPDQPANAICVYDTTGRKDGRFMATGEQLMHSGIQVMVRGKTYPDVWSKMNTIAEALDAQINTIVEFDTAENNYKIQNISRTGTPHSLGLVEEGSRRYHVFTINAITTLFETTDEAPFVGADWRPYWVLN